jgi:hypothetical protein
VATQEGKIQQNLLAAQIGLQDLAAINAPEVRFQTICAEYKALAELERKAMAGLCSGFHSLSASQACSCVKVQNLGSANLLDKIETHSASENATIKGQFHYHLLHKRSRKTKSPSTETRMSKGGSMFE